MRIQVLKSIFLLSSFVLTLPLSPSQFAQTVSEVERPTELKFNVVPTKNVYIVTSIPRSESVFPTERQTRRVERDTATLKDLDDARKKPPSLKVYVTNYGRNAVKSIVGQLLIIVDEREAARLAFTSNKKVGVNKVELLAKVDLRRLQRSVRDRFLSDLKYGYAVVRVRVQRVEYKDGSVWQHP